MQQTGNLLNRSEIKTFDSGFQVQEFYMDCKTYDQNTGQEYPNILKFQLAGDRINLLSTFTKGQRITVNFGLRGRTFQKDDGTTGHVQNLNVWKIEAVQNTAPQPTPTTQPQNPLEDDDDLPF